MHRNSLFVDKYSLPMGIHIIYFQLTLINEAKKLKTQNSYLVSTYYVLCKIFKYLHDKIREKTLIALRRCPLTRISCKHQRSVPNSTRKQIIDVGRVRLVQSQRKKHKNVLVLYLEV